MKKILLKHPSEVHEHIEILIDTANEAQMNILELSESCNGLQLLEKMKFEKIGFDPLNVQRQLNLIEQINQTFTYLASFKAVEILFQQHSEASEFILNLGTTTGTDIESKDAGGIAAEVFAATKPSSNNKLKKDINKVSATGMAHKYVFFLCPYIKPGICKEKSTKDVVELNRFAESQ